MKRSRLLSVVMFGLLCSSVVSAALFRARNDDLMWDQVATWELWSGSAWVAASTLPTTSDTVITASAAADVTYTSDGNPDNDPLYVRSYQQQGHASDNPAYWANGNDFWLTNRPNVPRGLQIDGTFNAATFHLGYVGGTDPTYPDSDTAGYTATVYIHYAAGSHADVNIGSIVNHNPYAAGLFRWTQYGGTVDVGSITLNTSLFEYRLQGGILTVTGAVSGTAMRVNIAGGMLVMAESVFDSFVSNGTIIQANGTAVNTGTVNSLLSVDRIRFPGYAAAVTAVGAAWNPSPESQAVSVPMDSDLAWSAGHPDTISYDVYFGTSPSAVSAARRLTGDINGDGGADGDDLSLLSDQWFTHPGSVVHSADIVFSGTVDFEDFAALAADWQGTADAVYMGNQTAATFDPGVLAGNTIYYWRIDEVNPANPDSPWRGEVWTFTTETPAPPATATNPSPANGASDVSVNSTISWTAGAGATSHLLYGGITNPPPFVTTLTSPFFDPALSPSTTYYWRIDEVNEYGTTIGPVWTFTTGLARLSPEQFPILPWSEPWRYWGPADSQQVFEEMYDCGFNLADFVTASGLNYAQAAGLKAVVFDGNLHVLDSMASLSPTVVQQRVSAAVTSYGSHPALYAYYLRDEPSSILFSTLKQFVDAFRAADPDHLSYINLFPNYASSSQLGGVSYQTYVDTFRTQVAPGYLCYDNYTFSSAPSYYWSNLSTIRTAARNSGVPFWNIVCCVQRSGWPAPSAATLRFQLYTSLAYGVKGIGWYQYFNWPSGLGVDFSLAPIDVYGNKTNTWYYLKDVNLALHVIGHTYVTLTNHHVFHTGSVPSGQSSLSSSLYLNSVSSSPSGFAVGEFTDPAGRRCVLLANKSLSSTAYNVNVGWKTSGTTKRVNPTTGIHETYYGTGSLAPGEGMLLIRY